MLKYNFNCCNSFQLRKDSRIQAERDVIPKGATQSNWMYLFKAVRLRQSNPWIKVKENKQKRNYCSSPMEEESLLKLNNYQQWCSTVKWRTAALGLQILSTASGLNGENYCPINVKTENKCWISPIFFSQTDFWKWVTFYFKELFILLVLHDHLLMKSDINWEWRNNT